MLDELVHRRYTRTTSNHPDMSDSVAVISDLETTLLHVLDSTAWPSYVNSAPDRECVQILAHPSTLRKTRVLVFAVHLNHEIEMPHVCMV